MKFLWLCSAWMWRFVNSSAVLIAATVFLVLCEFAIPSLYLKVFHLSYRGTEISSALFIVSASFLFFFLIPVIIAKLIYRESLSSLGVRLPTEYGKALLLTLLAFIMLLPGNLLISRYHSVHSYYLFKEIYALKLVIFFLIVMPCYYFFEEFFFRGFLLINLYKKIKWHGIWISDLVFALAHIAKPALELWLSFPAGIILAILALRTKSIYPCIVVHYILGVCMILSVNYFS